MAASDQPEDQDHVSAQAINGDVKGKGRHVSRTPVTASMSSSSSGSYTYLGSLHTREYSVSSSSGSSSANEALIGTRRWGRPRADTWGTVDSVNEDAEEAEDDEQVVTDPDDDQLVFQLSQDPGWTEPEAVRIHTKTQTMVAQPDRVALTLSTLPVEIKLSILKQVYLLAFQGPKRAYRTDEIDYFQPSVPIVSTASLVTEGRTYRACYAEGIKSLMRASRISKEWRSLVCDGNLWHHHGLDLSSPGIYDSLFEWRNGGAVLTHMFQASRGFLRELNLRGVSNLSGRVFSPLICRNLRKVNLKGCVSIPSGQLRRLFHEAPLLTHVNLAQVQTVDGKTLAALAKLGGLYALDLSFCTGLINEECVDRLALFLRTSESKLTLSSLKLANLTLAVDDNTMSHLAEYPNLLELDISASMVTDKGFMLWVKPLQEELQKGSHFRFVHINARQAGYTANSIEPDHRPEQEHVIQSRARDDRIVRRVLPLLRLTATNCKLLGEHAMSYLAFTTPHLQALSLAGSGSRRGRVGLFGEEGEPIRGSVRDSGLTALLNSLWEDERFYYVDISKASLFVPAENLLRRRPRGLIHLDLDDLAALSDSVLTSLTPPAEYLQEPGSRLVYLSVTGLQRLTTDGVSALVQNSPKLLTLNLDLTNMESSILPLFIQTIQRRPLDCRFASISIHDCRLIVASDIREVARFSRPAFAQPGPGWARNVGVGERETETVAEPKIGIDGSLITTRGELVDDFIRRLCADKSRPVVRQYWGWQYIRNGIVKGTIGLEAVISIESELAISSGLLPDLLGDFARRTSTLKQADEGRRDAPWNRSRLASLLSHLRSTIVSTSSANDTDESGSASPRTPPVLPPSPNAAFDSLNGAESRRQTMQGPGRSRANSNGRSRANSSASLFGSLVASHVLGPLSLPEASTTLMQHDTANGSSTSVTSSSGRSVRSIGSLFTRRHRDGQLRGSASPPLRARLVIGSSSSLTQLGSAEPADALDRQAASTPSSPFRLRIGRNRHRSGSGGAGSGHSNTGITDLSAIQFDPLRPGRLRSQSVGSIQGTGTMTPGNSSSLRQSTTLEHWPPQTLQTPSTSILPWSAQIPLDEPLQTHNELASEEEIRAEGSNDRHVVIRFERRGNGGRRETAPTPEERDDPETSCLLM